MLRVYQEHPEFDQFTKFDSQTGRLVTISEEEFQRYRPLGGCGPAGSSPIRKIPGRGATLFVGETPETHVRFPRRIYFQITRNCNLRCDYCYIKADRGLPSVPTGPILELADFLGEHGLVEVRLTGGEPTLHPDFFAILHRFQERGVYVSVATNGVWDRGTLDALCAEDPLWIICSVDGNRETHNQYRPGTFDRIVRNLEHLKNKKPSTRIRLTTVLTRRNKGQMFELAEVGARVQAESITVIPLRPQVRSSEIRADMVAAGEFKNVIEDLIRAKDQFGVPFTTTMETDYQDKLYRDPIVRKRSSCAAGREATNLDYDDARREFVVYGCSYSPASDLAAPPALRLPFLAGTFRADDVGAFLRIWRDEDAWRIYRDLSIRSRNCQGCTYLAKHRCTGSCPIQNIDYARINVDGDVLSQLKEQITRTGEWYCYKGIIG
jgi:MoaA/NifB/PqqE/SkfB family radical SAM enzyme